MVNIVEVRNENDFFSLKDVWNDLMSRSNENNVFLTWEWVSTWWKYFGNNHEMFVLVAEDNGEIIAIAPLMFSKYDMFFYDIKKIEFIGTPDSDYNGFIITDKAYETLKAFFNRMINYSDKWDFLTFKDIPDDSKYAYKFTYLLRDNKNFLKRIVNKCPYKLLDSTYEEFYKKLNKKFRKNLRYRENRARKLGDVEYKTYDEMPSIKEAMDTFFELNTKRFSDLNKKQTFRDPMKRSFHQEIAELFNDKGWLKLGFLTINGIPVSTEYSFNYNNKVFAYLSGFDPEYSKYGVGRLCELHHFKYLIENGFKEYDWLRGFESYIKDWTTTYKFNLELRFTKGNFLSYVYKLGRSHEILINTVFNNVPSFIKEKFRYV